MLRVIKVGFCFETSGLNERDVIHLGGQSCILERAQVNDLLVNHNHDLPGLTVLRDSSVRRASIIGVN